MTTNLFVDSLIKGGMHLEHDGDGDTVILRLIPGKGMLDDRAVFEKRAGAAWFCIVQGYGLIPMSPSTFQTAAESDPQAVLDEVARRLEGITVK